jgi:hypothetical protein
MKTDTFRVVTNGFKYRVERLETFLFGRIRWWRPLDNRIGTAGTPCEFDCEEEAVQFAVNAYFTTIPMWRVVRKISSPK